MAHALPIVTSLTESWSAGADVAAASAAPREAISRSSQHSSSSVLIASRTGRPTFATVASMYTSDATRSPPREATSVDRTIAAIIYIRFVLSAYCYCRATCGGSPRCAAVDAASPAQLRACVTADTGIIAQRYECPQHVKYCCVNCNALPCIKCIFASALLKGCRQSASLAESNTFVVSTLPA